MALVRDGAPAFTPGGPRPRHEGDTRRGAERPQEPARERSPPIPPSKENNIYNFSSLREGLSGVNARDPLGEEGSGKIPRARLCAVHARVSRVRVTCACYATSVGCARGRPREGRGVVGGGDLNLG